MTTKKKAASERKAYTAPAIEKSEVTVAEITAVIAAGEAAALPAVSAPDCTISVAFEAPPPVRLARRWSLTPDGAHYQHAVTGETVPTLTVVAQGKAGEGIEAVCTRLAAEARDAR